MQENVRRPSGLTINGIPSADEIVEIGRNSFLVAAALDQWKNGRANFDEALRLAVFFLADQNRLLIDQLGQFARYGMPPIVIESPIPLEIDDLGCKIKYPEK